MIVFSVSPVEAHRNGCHAAHSCPSDTGSYVCGDTGNSSECGSAPQPTTAAAPTSMPIKQFVAPVATSVPTDTPTRVPTTPTTVTPTIKAARGSTVTPSVTVAGKASSNSGAGGLMSLGIL